MFVIIGDKAKAASRSDIDLCQKCANFFKRKNAITDEEERYCDFSRALHPFHLKGPISECNQFYDRTKPSIHDLQKIAWTIETSAKKVGFAEMMEVQVTSPKERTKEQQKELDNL